MILYLSIFFSFLYNSRKRSVSLQNVQLHKSILQGSTREQAVTCWSVLMVFAASICHSEAVRGDSLVLPVWEVQTPWNNRSGQSSRNWPRAQIFVLKNQAAIFPVQAKAAIRELLPSGLREAISKVRSSVAYAISAIAHWDWPEAWPRLFTLLMEMLVSGDVNAVHGAMRVLTGVSW